MYHIFFSLCSPFSLFFFLLSRFLFFITISLYIYLSFLSFLLYNSFFFFSYLSAHNGRRVLSLFTPFNILRRCCQRRCQKNYLHWTNSVRSYSLHHDFFFFVFFCCIFFLHSYYFFSLFLFYHNLLDLVKVL